MRPFPGWGSNSALTRVAKPDRKQFFRRRFFWNDPREDFLLLLSVKTGDLRDFLQQECA